MCLKSKPASKDLRNCHRLACGKFTAVTQLWHNTFSLSPSLSLSLSPSSLSISRVPGYTVLHAELEASMMSQPASEQ